MSLYMVDNFEVINTLCQDSDYLPFAQILHEQINECLDFVHLPRLPDIQGENPPDGQVGEESEEEKENIEDQDENEDDDNDE